jgi:hypothetical protein
MLCYLSGMEPYYIELPEIYGKFVYEDNLITRRYPGKAQETKKTLTSSPISTAFYSNGVVQDFQDGYDDEVYERTCEEYLNDLQIEFNERALLENSRRFIKRNKKFFNSKANDILNFLNVVKRVILQKTVSQKQP